MPKWSDYIRNLGTAGPTTVQGIYNLGFALRSEIPALFNKYVRVDAAQSFTVPEKTQGRSNLGLGTVATQDASNVDITGGSIAGITDLAISDGGTGASTPSAARSNLGLGNVDNTSDANKPVSTATQSALNLKLDILQPWVTVASASTTNVGAASSQNVIVTGSTAITSLGSSAAGILRRVQFSGALTLIYNATSLVLPGGSNIVTTAGDIAVFFSEGSGNWRCLGYFPASPVPNTANGQYKFPATQNPSTDANTLDDYEEGVWSPVITQGVVPSTSIKTGTYTKVGRTVTVTLVATFSSAGTAANVIEVSGLPFVPNGANQLCFGAAYFFDSGSQFYGLSAVLSGAGTIIFYSHGGTGNFGSAPSIAIASNDRLSFTVTYEV